MLYVYGFKLDWYHKDFDQRLVEIYAILYTKIV